MTKEKNKEIGNEIENAINTLKEKKESKGIIPVTKKIVVVNGKKEFKGKSLKIQKGLFKNGQNYTYKAGTKWDDIDNFGKKNITFNESDFD